MSVETLQSQLEDIQTATNNIKTALEEKGETPTGGIQTFAASVSNLGNINTVNGIGADENRNAQLDASKINVDDTAETKETIKSALENKQETLVSGTNIKTLNGETLLGAGNIAIKNIDYVYSWDGQSSSTNPDNIALWQEIINKAKEGTSDILVITHGASSYQHFLFVINEKCLGSKMSTFKSVVSDAGTSYSTNSAQETTGVDYYSDKGQVTIQHDANYVVSNVSDVSENTTRLGGYLPTNNTKITNWTPTYDYHPATKKYVDDSIDPINKLIYNAEPVQGTESHTGTYYFAWDNTNKRYVSNNHAQSSTTATSTLTVPSDGADMYNISWTVSSEFNFDKFSLVVNGSTVVTSSDSLQKGEYSVNPGTTVTINYSKDGSGDNLDDQATVQIIPVNKASKASIGYVMDSVSTLNTKISNIKQAETFDGTVFGGWHMYSDGENLTKDAGFTSADWDNIVVGNILSYPSSTDSSSSVNTSIIYVSTGYAYKSAGGRYYYRTFKTGSGSSYEISGDLLGTGNIFKGLTIDEGSSGGGGGMACFTANTKVATENGYKSISEIKVGDLVYSYNYKTKEVELKEVDKLVTHDTDEIYNIKVNDEVIETTWSHPFYVVNEKVARGRIQARCLVVGDILLGKDGKLFKVDKVEPINRSEKVYEIRVKDNNCYFVGDTSILVYNEESVLKDE